MTRVLSCLLAALLGAPALLAAQPPPPAHVVMDWKRVLVIGAHPDDEDTHLIAWLQLSGRAETAYLSVTRGDGGQNLIGNELGEELGIIRTQELLAARRIDGAHQYFTRAYDFGFSKSAEETWNHWPKDSLLGDVVKVVRAFRPHVIVAIFSGTSRDGHGQHQVSGVLAREAYALAGDTVRFPAGTFGPAWTPLKLYRSSRFNPAEATLRFNVGEYNPRLGRSYAEIAGESRSQHRSQGFGAIQRKGVVWDYLTREATRVNQSTAASEERSPFDGIAVPAPAEVDGNEELEELRRAVALEALADRRIVALGDSALVTATIYNRTSAPIHVVPGGADRPAVLLPPDSAYRWTFFHRGSAISQPWWLATPRHGDLFSPPIPVRGSGVRDIPGVAWASEDEREKETAVGATIFRLGGGRGTTKTAPIVFRVVDPILGDLQTPVATVPRISVSLERTGELARANAPLDRFFSVILRSASLSPATVTVSLLLPAGLTADSAARTVQLDSAATRSVTFRVRGQVGPGAHRIGAQAAAGGVTYSSGFTPIAYDHIAPQRIYRDAALTLHAIDVAIPSGTSVAYITGVGDNVGPALQQLGIPVTNLEPRAIPTVDLSRFTAVVVGPRAYQANPDLVHNNAALLEYAQHGGTLVVQYGQYEMMRPGIMPHAITINRPHDRVTVEQAPVTILDPSASVFSVPNRITQRDFAGWVQERSLYMPRAFDASYRPLLALGDPGEPPSRGGIIVAQHGRGLYVYTTLAFFRQLPAGVSGATRLFINLISMKPSEPGRSIPAGGPQ